MRKYICLFLVGFFLGFWEDQKERFDEIDETQKLEIIDNSEVDFDNALFIHPVEKLPIFKNGTNKDFLTLMMTKLVYPNEGCSNSFAVLSFTVNKKGIVEDAKIRKSMCPKVDNQLLDIIKDVTFTPGMIDGEIVPFNMNLPIRICIR